MSIELRVPQLSETVADATLIAWRKQPGQPVRRDEQLAELETDKIVLEVSAPVDGILREVRVADGTTVRSGELLALIDEGAEPAVEPVRATVPAIAPAVVEAAPTPVAPGRAERRVAMSRLRKRIATHLVEASTSQALVTTVNEVDLSAVQALRARYHAMFDASSGVKLGILPFFVAAVVEALQRFPILNARIDGDDIVYADYYDVGIAVSTDRGVIVPVVRAADRKGVREHEQAIAGYAERARAGAITLDELAGGTFTISNGGVFGSLLSTPIVHAPQSAILGMHKVQDRPIAVNGAVEIRPMMYLALTYDHRLIDGHEAVQFLVAVKECLEDTRRLVAVASRGVT
jgi:2-oxoglutarate dehydrogenase E2 component (dihydrolipoamide succinyltransferase)